MGTSVSGSNFEKPQIDSVLPSKLDIEPVRQLDKNTTSIESIHKETFSLTNEYQTNNKAVCPYVKENSNNSKLPSYLAYARDGRITDKKIANAEQKVAEAEKAIDSLLREAKREANKQIKQTGNAKSDVLFEIATKRLEQAKAELAVAKGEERAKEKLAIANADLKVSEAKQKLEIATKRSIQQAKGKDKADAGLIVKIAFAELTQAEAELALAKGEDGAKEKLAIANAELNLILAKETVKTLIKPQKERERGDALIPVLSFAEKKALAKLKQAEAELGVAKGEKGAEENLIRAKAEWKMILAKEELLKDFEKEENIAQKKVAEAEKANRKSILEGLKEDWKHTETKNLDLEKLGEDFNKAYGDLEEIAKETKGNPNLSALHTKIREALVANTQVESLQRLAEAIVLAKEEVKSTFLNEIGIMLAKRVLEVLNKAKIVTIQSIVNFTDEHLPEMSEENTTSSTPKITPSLEEPPSSTPVTEKAKIELPDLTDKIVIDYAGAINAYDKATKVYDEVTNNPDITTKLDAGKKFLEAYRTFVDKKFEGEENYAPAYTKQDEDLRIKTEEIIEKLRKLIGNLFQETKSRFEEDDMKDYKKNYSIVQSDFEQIENALKAPKGASVKQRASFLDLGDIQSDFDSEYHILQQAQEYLVLERELEELSERASEYQDF